jgi:hypothetical protein
MFLGAKLTPVALRAPSVSAQKQGSRAGLTFPVHWDTCLWPARRPGDAPGKHVHFNNGDGIGSEQFLGGTASPSDPASTLPVLYVAVEGTLTSYPWRSTLRSWEPCCGRAAGCQDKKMGKTLDGCRSLIHTERSLRRFAPI